MLLLAANPEVQDWVAEELQKIHVTDESKTWEYSELFTRFKRCRAVLVSITPCRQAWLKLQLHIFLARDPSPLSTYYGPSKMDQRASSAAPDRRKDDRDPAANRRNFQPSRNSYAPPILARSSSLATFPMDPSFYSSRTALTHSRPTLGRYFNASTEHIFPLVRRPTELPRCEICAS